MRELVYLAAYQLENGESVSRPGPVAELPNTRLGEALRVTADQVGLDPQLGARLLYGDASAEVAAAAAARLRPVGRPVFRACPRRSPGAPSR
ncbi:MAG: hypothetical protein M3Q22_17205 [Actinomycetota bacterium]|nr:hypothetical protein [Actinomycetota bacterium]